MTIDLTKIPSELKDRPQWVLWKIGERDGKETKLPYQLSGSLAESDNPATWSPYEAIVAKYAKGGYSGIGYVFAKDDPYCGIDLDGCRGEDGKFAEWAREALKKLDSYAEISPSGTGVKIFVKAESPFASGKKITLKSEAEVSNKKPGIEVYDHLRYFAITGNRVKGPHTPQERPGGLTWLKKKYWPDAPATATPDFRSADAVVERARKYVARVPPSISGSGGHNAAFHAACILVLGFGLSESEAIQVMNEFNQRCDPPWSEREINHKVQQANKQPGERCYLRNTTPERWSSVSVPRYEAPPPEPEPRETTLFDAAKAYVETIRSGKPSLIETGIGDLDYALGGGVERGEMVILAARPSHGKSAVGLQCIHFWTAHKMPCAIVSEEMASLALGKRTVQFLSDVPQEYWHDLLPQVEKTVDEYGKEHSKCIVLEGCGTAATARDAIARVVEEEGVQCVVVDYAQLLGGIGRDRYQQMTNMSITLRQLASKHKIVLLALCQMSRDIEKRQAFSPTMSDIKECLVGDSRITIADTGSQISIREIVERGLRPKVWSMDDEWKIVTRTVTDAWQSGLKRVYRVKLRSGRELVCTKEHWFFSEDGWKHIGDVDLGDMVAVPRVYKTETPSAGNESKFLLLGWLIGDGCLNGSPVLTVANEEVQMALSLGLQFKLSPRVEPEKLCGKVKRIVYTTGRRCGAGKNPLTSWLRKIGCWKKSGKNKIIPDCVFVSSNSEVASFLRGLFHADGCLSGRNRIRLSTISEMIARSVQHLLLRLGILSGVHSGKHSGKYGVSHCTGTKVIWTVEITSKERIGLFLDVVGFLGDKQVMAIRNFDSSSKRRSFSRHVDSLPAMASELAGNIRQEKRASHVAFGWRDQGKRMNRETATKLGCKWNSPLLRQYGNSEVLWDELMSVEDEGEQMTYDLTVADTHNYVANDIIVHNTGQLEQDADVIVFCVWPHRLDQNEPVNKFQFHISKNRNRQINQTTVTVRFLPDRQAVLDPLPEFSTRQTRQDHFAL
jgi:replicative DNA helicase